MPLKLLPAVAVLAFFSGGMMTGALTNHLSLGALVGLGIGMCAGLGVLLKIKR